MIENIYFSFQFFGFYAFLLSLDDVIPAIRIRQTLVITRRTAHINDTQAYKILKLRHVNL